jgi:hypothetical protein
MILNRENIENQNLSSGSFSFQFFMINSILIIECEV